MVSWINGRGHFEAGVLGIKTNLKRNMKCYLYMVG